MREVGNQTQGDVWATLIDDAKLDAQHFDDACYEYETARKQLPEPLDNLIHDLISTAKDARHGELEKLEQYEKYHRPKPGDVYKAVTSTVAGKAGVELGVWLKEKKITSEQNIERLEQAFAYERGDVPKPDWLDEVLSAADRRKKSSNYNA